MAINNKMPYRTRADSVEIQSKIAEVLNIKQFDPQQSYSDQMTERLRNAIICGTLLPGMVLSEASISSVVGISRTPIREALRNLAIEKLVDVYPQAGTVIAPVRLSLLNEGIFIRSALECKNITDLVTFISPEQIGKLRIMINEQKNTLTDGLHNEFFLFDDAFHRLLFEFTGRVHVWELIMNVKVHLDRVRHLLLERIKVHAKRALGEHQEICEMLEGKRINELSEAVHNHIFLITQHLLELRETSPSNYFSD